MISKSRVFGRIACFLIFLAGTAGPPAALAQPPQFINYQSRLVQGTNLVNGSVTLGLRIYDAPAGGTLLYEDSNTVTVVDGLYSTFIGDNTLSGNLQAALGSAQVWLETVVNGSALAPRERIVSVAYSLLSGDAMTVGGLLPSSFASTSNLAAEAAFRDAADAAISTLLAAKADSNIVWGTFATTNALAAEAVLRAAADVALSNAVALKWSLTGNAGTTPGVDFVGTTDNQPLELRVNGQRVWTAGTNLPVSIVAGAPDNVIADDVAQSVIGGGSFNLIEQDAGSAIIAGGGYNVIGTNADYATVGGGLSNHVGGAGSVIAGGSNNRISTNSTDSLIAGGILNVIGENAANAVILGGKDNLVETNASYAVIAGGLSNTATRSHTFAAGRRAKARHQGSFVWADSRDADFGSGDTNQFLIRADYVGIGGTNRLNSSTYLGVITPPTNAFGGMYIATAGAAGKPFYGYATSTNTTRAYHYVDGPDGVKWKLNVGGVDRIIIEPINGFVGIGISTPTNRIHVTGGAQCNGTVWLDVSDRNAKHDFAPVDGQVVLAKLASLPVLAWRYKEDAKQALHIGPMAQDFYAAFGYGDNETTMSGVDRSGVALAAIQALNSEVQSQQAEIGRLKEQLAELRREMIQRGAAR